LPPVFGNKVCQFVCCLLHGWVHALLLLLLPSCCCCCGDVKVVEESCRWELRARVSMVEDPRAVDQKQQQQLNLWRSVGAWGAAEALLCGLHHHHCQHQTGQLVVAYWLGVCSCCCAGWLVHRGAGAQKKGKGEREGVCVGAESAGVFVCWAGSQNHTPMHTGDTGAWGSGWWGVQSSESQVFIVWSQKFVSHSLAPSCTPSGVC
jgi:hypothetical protein